MVNSYFLIIVKIHDFLIVYVVYFEIVFYPHRDFLGASWTLKTNYTLNLNNFSTARPILDLEMSLDVARQLLKLLSQGETPKILDLFKITVKKHDFLIV